MLFLIYRLYLKKYFYGTYTWILVYFKYIDRYILYDKILLIISTFCIFPYTRICLYEKTQVYSMKIICLH